MAESGMLLFSHVSVKTNTQHSLVSHCVVRQSLIGSNYYRYINILLKPIPSKPRENFYPTISHLSALVFGAVDCRWWSGLMCSKIPRFYLLNSQWERVKISVGRTNKTTFTMFNKKVPVHTHRSVIQSEVFYWSRGTMMDLGWDQVWFGLQTLLLTLRKKCTDVISTLDSVPNKYINMKIKLILYGHTLFALGKNIFHLN